MSLDEQAERLEIDADFETANEELYQRNLTDGLPVVPPTEERVKAMMATTDRDPDEVVGVMPPRYGDATVEDCD